MTVKFLLGSYDPSKEYFPLTIIEAGIDRYTITLSVPLKDAREFKSHIQNVEVFVSKQLNHFLKYNPQKSVKFFLFQTGFEIL